MKKVFILPPGEDWIADRQVSEYRENNTSRCVDNPHIADIIWLFADWAWTKLPFRLLQQKTVVTTVHHIVPAKFDKQDFMLRDNITDIYHVPNKYTHDVIRNLTTKRIEIIPYWANSSIWTRSVKSKKELRLKHDLPVKAFIAGSFQRDTEGFDLKSPKLEKGPDILAQTIAALRDSKPTIHVLLAGWRRQYIMTELQKLDVAFTFFDRPEQPVLNELYQTLDLYPVTSRYEGGPQAFIECALLGVPMISTPVGMSYMVLPEKSIAKEPWTAEPSTPTLPAGCLFPEVFEIYNRFLESVQKHV
jgi:glycosyltransferase involved in cell wall biosynthesis